MGDRTGKFQGTDSTETAKEKILEQLSAIQTRDGKEVEKSKAETLGGKEGEVP